MSSLFDLPFDEERPAAEPRPPASSRTNPYTVTELTADIRGVLETGFADVYVEGELTNCRPWHTGHIYFTLKDAGSQIKGVMFRSAARFLKFKPEDGQHVIARGRVSVYDAKGEYQIICESFEPRGLGALQLAFEQLRNRLAAEGLFDQSRKRPLPLLPRRIGVVTSLDGAAIQDILTVLKRRYPNAQIVIRPARVQGDGRRK
jgi:exodeoxyribonuclease VII large subunit